MNDIIIGKLKEIEKKENVKIIYALESGSRGWGFPSPDSDYDVRFIYVRKPEYYLRLEKTSDVIEWQLDEMLDINGWDLKKALVLIQKSNPTLLEWCSSPIVYKTTPFWEKVRQTASQHFSPRVGMYHYAGIAESAYREFLTGDTVKLKKYFYAVRPILACEWILKYNSIPPMEFKPLVDEFLPQELKPALGEITQIKMNTPEKKCIPKSAELNSYIEERISALKSSTADIAMNPRTDWDDLNALFLEALNLTK